MQPKTRLKSRCRPHRPVTTSVAVHERLFRFVTRLLCKHTLLRSGSCRKVSPVLTLSSSKYRLLPCRGPFFQIASILSLFNCGARSSLSERTPSIGGISSLDGTITGGAHSTGGTPTIGGASSFVGTFTNGTTTTGGSTTTSTALIATKIAAGWHFSCAVLTDASVKCWGNNSSGQLYGHHQRGRGRGWGRP